MTEDGRLEVFAVGSDGALWHTWQSTPHGGPWHGWASLGGSVTSITAGRNGDGRLEVFGIGTDGALWHVWQTRAGTGGWGNWDSLGGGGGGGLQQIAAVTNGVAQLAVFALGADGTGSYLAQVHPSGGWGAWTPLGTRALELLPMRNESGRLEVFAVGAGSAVFHSWGQNPDFGLIDSTLQWTDRPWSPWTSLGGRAQAITAAVNDDGRLEVFAAGADGGVSHLWQKARSAGPWSGWSPMGGSAVQLSAAKNGDGRLEVFALGGDGTVTHAWQKAPSSAPWSGWSSLGGSVREIAAAANSDGRLEVFGIGTDGAVWHAWQRASDRSRWTGWQSLGQP
jgi:acylphosphatase